MSDEPAGGDEVVEVQGALLPGPFGVLFEYGMRVDFIQVPTNLPNPLAVTALTACEPLVLYAVMPDTDGPFFLYFSSDGGQTFTKPVISGTSTPAAAKSAEIARDDGKLFTIGTVSGSMKIFFASRANGNIATRGPRAPRRPRSITSRAATGPSTACRTWEPSTLFTRPTHT